MNTKKPHPKFIPWSESELKAENERFKKYSEENPWKLVGEEAENERREYIKELTTELGFSIERAERLADNYIEATNETAKEYGEDV